MGACGKRADVRRSAPVSHNKELICFRINIRISRGEREGVLLRPGSLNGVGTMPAVQCRFRVVPIGP